MATFQIHVETPDSIIGLTETKLREVCNELASTLSGVDVDFDVTLYDELGPIHAW